MNIFLKKADFQLCHSRSKHTLSALSVWFVVPIPPPPPKKAPGEGGVEWCYFLAASAAFFSSAREVRKTVSMLLLFLSHIRWGRGALG